ncbi:MAG: hypothetical protein ACRC3Y_00180 [Romboutsia sp.]|uniref:hypothetical protein n=1 Tax=Romboutsia sp. TaxID=1965302 RepID=UPI003F2D96C1
MEDIRERISSSINLYLSKANLYRDESAVLVEYIEKKFIKVDSNYYINLGGAQESSVSDEDMEWTVETFVERLYKRRTDGYNKNNTYNNLSCKVVNLEEYRELRGRE